MSDFDYESLVIDIPDYPEPGVIFKDITPLFKDPEAFRALVDDIAEHFAGKGITKVVGAEARGFLVGPPVAYKLGAGFIPARKPGKLPRAVYSESYALEYGTDTIEVHQDAFEPGDNVLVVDDLIATGGTSLAVAKLVEKTGAHVEGFAFLLELCFLNPREVIARDFGDREVYTLVKVN